MTVFARNEKGQILKLERLTITCCNCNKSFERLPKKIISKNVFCSATCRNKFYGKIIIPPSRKGFRKYPDKSNKKVYNKRLRSLWSKAYKKRYALAGKMSVKEIQSVYEDNIKKYGTLTCVYCLTNIRFGNDSIDHKIPLIKGGKHCYENLAIACRNCNSKKHTKTSEEFIGVK